MKRGVIVFLLLSLFLGVTLSQSCSASNPCGAGLCCSPYGYCGNTPQHCTTSGASSSSSSSSSGARVCPTPCAVGECCSQYGYCGTTAEHCAGTTPVSSSGSSATSSAPPPPPSGGSIRDVFTQNDFNVLFPNANGGARNGVAYQKAIFTYDNIVNAAAYYPTFGTTGDVATRKREIAAFLAQTSQETSGWWSGQPYNWGYYYSSELGCTNGVCTQYCAGSSTYPCAPGKSYYGRGPLQLSWNTNYGQVSKAVFGDLRLLNDPDQILSSGLTAFRTSLWFWMTTQNPKPSCHDVITGIWQPSSYDNSVRRYSGFGMTTNIINGGLECNRATPQKVINRVKYFERYAAHFGIPTGSNLYCDQMAYY